MSSDFRNRSVILEAVGNMQREQATVTVLFHATIAEKLGLRPADHKALEYVANGGAVTAGELSQLTGLTTGAVTGVIDRLEKAGFVQREQDPNDRRRVLIRLRLDECERRILPLFQSLKPPLDEVYANYSDQELAVVLDFLTKTIKMMQEWTNSLRNG